MLRKMFPGVLVLCVMMVFTWTGCSNSTGSDDIGVSGTFIQIQQADGSSTPAIYRITVLGTAARNGTCTITMDTMSDSASVEKGAVSGQIASGIRDYFSGMAAITTDFIIGLSQNSVTLTAKTNNTLYNNLTCSISFN
jgi:phage tail sheath gpL-like